jgi:hypothetical protein
VIRRQVHEFSGLEFDWLACDQDGFVAMFSSAGFGPVPEDAVHLASVRGALEGIMALPVTGQATSIGGTTTPDDWIAAAQRGLFAFDWTHARDRYQLEALPSRAVNLGDIKDDVIRSAAECVRIAVRFPELRWINWDATGYLSFGAEL